MLFYHIRRVVSVNSYSFAKMTRYLKTWLSKLAALAILLWLAEPLPAEPAVTLIHTAKSFTFSAQVKWLPELDTGHRFNGDWVWVSLGLQF